MLIFEFFSYILKYITSKTSQSFMTLLNRAGLSRISSKHIKYINFCSVNQVTKINTTQDVEGLKNLPGKICSITETLYTY